MRIGLIRHFKVKHKPNYLKWMSADQFARVIDDYDQSELIMETNVLNYEDWDICYCSDLIRTKKTAKTIYTGTIVETMLLREIIVDPFIAGNIKLPYFVWLLLGRFLWLFSHRSQSETKTSVRKRIKKVLDDIESETYDNVLVCSHGALMYFFRKELLRRGYKGDAFLFAKNSRLYVFEKESSSVHMKGNRSTSV